MLSINASRRLEQQQLLESLRSYDPWGRAGGGAPAGDVRRRDLMSRYIYPQFPTLWGDHKERIPPMRIRHRPRRSILTSDLAKNPINFPKEIPDCVEYCRHDRQAEIDKTLPEVRSNKVWSGDPWDSRGPWGRSGPGGNPWRPAGHVGRNFHHSMGWTTENTFNFPSINNVAKNCVYDNTMRQLNSMKKGVRIKDDRKYETKIDNHKMPPIDDKDVVNSNASMGQRCAGRTPNNQLLSMTGGIELVPLMRARDWTFKQRPPHVDYLTQIANNSHSVFQ